MYLISTGLCYSTRKTIIRTIIVIIMIRVVINKMSIRQVHDKSNC
jgi:hypothetical protein